MRLREYIEALSEHYFLCLYLYSYHYQYYYTKRICTNYTQ